MHAANLSKTALHIVELLDLPALDSIGARLFRSIPGGVSFEFGPAGTAGLVHVVEVGGGCYNVKRTSLRRGLRLEFYSNEGVEPGELSAALARVATLHP